MKFQSSKGYTEKSCQEIGIGENYDGKQQLKRIPRNLIPCLQIIKKKTKKLRTEGMSHVCYLRVSEVLKVELQTGMSCHVGAGNDPNTLEEQAEVPSWYYLHSKNKFP